MTDPTNLALSGLDRLSELKDRLLSWASPERSYIADALRVAALKSGDRFLDVGCGSGELLAAAATREPGALLYGVDPDEDALELASRKIFGTLRPVELHQAVAEALPFESDFFDVVAATLLLQGMPVSLRHEVLAECRRVLRPGGRLIVADWIGEPEGLHALLAYPTDLVRRYVFSQRRPMNVVESLKACGFFPPELRGTFSTVLGTIELHEAYKPLHG
ncbi:MAG TPA: methyltransferase domain-containing protein [Candidatus Limnocylindrales bacterium]|nr:methyltransferase domain-containing protein [Candidatus Limnocylindrales bacterium]